MHDRYARSLIDHVRHDSYLPATPQKIAEDLAVPEWGRQYFEDAVKSMSDDGEIEIDGRGRVMLPSVGDEVTGIFRLNKRGFGFIILDRKVREGDIFVPEGATEGALSGDRVRASIEWTRHRGELTPAGSIVEVLSRKQTSFSGSLRKQGGVWIVDPDGRNISTPIVVTDPGAKNAKAGDKVVVEIVHYPEGDMLAEGVITKVLGEAGEPSVETQAVIATYNLPGEFPNACHDQARDATAGFEADVEAGERDGFTDREDWRERFTATIDPPDARDYDDAISISRTKDGWELAVHIADVSHFVEPGTPLDVEGYKRGNSCYLPRLVIPMLPEILSNGICSLAEDVTRFCKTAIVRYDRHGKVLAEGVAQTVIRSNKRMTYLEAQAIIDGDLEEAKKHAKTEPEYSDELIAAVKEMDRLARAIRDRRRRAGMIHLDLPDAELVFDDDGNVIDVEPEDDAFTHTIIEMFMVEANEVLGRLFARMEVPLLRRIHPDPTPGDKDELSQSVKVAGYNLPKNPDRKELQSILDATAGTPAAPAVHMAALRTLAKAEYSPMLIGHYALASEAYAHFTSPIRRYPDLTVHRALAAYLAATENGSSPPTSEAEQLKLGKKLRDVLPSDEDLREVGRSCSSTEVNAADAERALRQYLVLRFLEQHADQEFGAIITGVSPRQVFVQLEKYLADGAIQVADLPSDGKYGGRWRVDSRSGALVNANSGRSFNMGDRIVVRIAEIDLQARQMNVVLADTKARGAVGKPKDLGGGLGEGGLNIDWDTFKGRKSSGSTNRSRRSKQRDRGKSDYRKDRKNKGKR